MKNCNMCGKVLEVPVYFKGYTTCGGDACKYKLTLLINNILGREHEETKAYQARSEYTFSQTESIHANSDNLECAKS